MTLVSMTLLHPIALYNEIRSCTFSLQFSAFLLPRKSLQMFSNASPALLSVAFYFVLKAWCSNICLICGPTKIPSCNLASLFWEMFASIGKPFTSFIHRQPKALKMSCSKFSAPKIYLYLRSYRQNTVHKFFSFFESGFLCDFNTTSPQI